MTDQDPAQHDRPESADARGRRRWLGIPGLRGALVGTGDAAPPATPRSSKQNQKQLTGKLAGLSLPRQVWVLALWPLLEQVMNFLVDIIAMFLVTKFSVRLLKHQT
ncbi:MAG: hypothetical protein ACPGYV_15325 [Phycisphaeraceae bacterium]